MTAQFGGGPDLLNTMPPLGISESGKPYCVLVVDDSSTMRKLVSQKLRAAAFEICGEATNGKDAVKMYMELLPDAVTLDINMPVMSGLEALSSLIELDGNAKIIMITGEGHSETVVKALKQGARGYVVKPFNKGDLCKRVRDAITD